jgi:adenylate cyclase
MDEKKLSEIAVWITKAGLAGRPETEMVTGFCDRVRGAGVPLSRGVVFIDTLHPIHEGHAVIWQHDVAETTQRGYGRTGSGQGAQNWQRSPFYRLIETGESFLRRRVTEGSADEFPVVRDLMQQGMTDYLCVINRFAPEGVIGEMDGVYSGWASDHPEGFSDDNVESIRKLLPFLALAMKSATLGQMAQTLVETYLGRDAGRMVMRGHIARGVADRIETVLWFSDLRGYTHITDTSPPEQVIPLLNDYAEAIISAVHENGGDVLKLMGDGVLAIFRADAREAACRCAISAAKSADKAISLLNERRSAEGLPTTSMYLGLHVGDVFFGNIGSTSRLDFTVVGPAVNEVSRIGAMCRSVDQALLASSAFAAALGDAGPALVSVGRYALRGVGAPQELFTLDPSD